VGALAGEAAGEQHSGQGESGQPARHRA
jgi:hypothetical protein